MEIWILWCYDDGIIGAYTSEKLAESVRIENHENNYWHYEDQVIKKVLLESEVIND